MGTLRDEMTKVLNEWDKQDEVISQPQQEIKMEEHTTATRKLIAFIEANPGIASTDLRKTFLAQNPHIPEGNLSSMLTQLTRKYTLSREETEEAQKGGKTVYAYTAIPEADREKLRARAAEKLKAAQARMEKARQVKAAKQAAREQLDKMLGEQSEQRTGLRDLLPPSVATTSIYNTKHTPAPEWTADSVINSLNVMQARQLYVALKEIFGG